MILPKDQQLQEVKTISRARRERKKMMLCRAHMYWSAKIVEVPLLPLGAAAALQEAQELVLLMMFENL